MPYFDYHGNAKKLIKEGHLAEWYITPKYNAISPALVLCFDDFKRHIMPIREHKWIEYMGFLPVEMERKL